MSFKDIFKKSFLEGFASTEITTLTVVTALGVACLLALYIFFVYRVVTRKTFYSKNFNITLAGVTVITASLILTMQSSVVLSLGMVGALSIVRFRTAVKDPLDTAYMFWALTMGILLGAGYFLIAVIVAIAIALLIFVLNSVKIKKEDSYLLVMHYDDYAEQAIERVLRTQRFRHLKSKTVTRMGVEMTVELRVDANNTSKLINTLLDQEGVHDATLVAYQNEAG